MYMQREQDIEGQNDKKGKSQIHISILQETCVILIHG